MLETCRNTIGDVTSTYPHAAHYPGFGREALDYRWLYGQSQASAGIARLECREAYHLIRLIRPETRSVTHRATRCGGKIRIAAFGPRKQLFDGT